MILLLRAYRFFFFFSVCEVMNAFGVFVKGCVWGVYSMFELRDGILLYLRYFICSLYLCKVMQKNGTLLLDAPPHLAFSFVCFVVNCFLMEIYSLKFKSK